MITCIALDTRTAIHWQRIHLSSSFDPHYCSYFPAFILDMTIRRCVQKETTWAGKEVSHRMKKHKCAWSSPPWRRLTWKISVVLSIASWLITSVICGRRDANLEAGYLLVRTLVPMRMSKPSKNRKLRWPLATIRISCDSLIKCPIHLICTQFGFWCRATWFFQTFGRKRVI